MPKEMRKKPRMGSMNLASATLLQKVSSALYDGTKNTKPKSIASAMNSFFHLVVSDWLNKTTTTWWSYNSSKELRKSHFQLVESEESFVLQ